MRPRLVAALAVASWVILWLPPARSALESDTALQMAVQMPLLIGLGLLLAVAFSGYEPR